MYELCVCLYWSYLIGLFFYDFEFFEKEKFLYCVSDRILNKLVEKFVGV